MRSSGGDPVMVAGRRTPSAQPSQARPASRPSGRDRNGSAGSSHRGGSGGRITDRLEEIPHFRIAAKFRGGGEDQGPEFLAGAGDAAFDRAEIYLQLAGDLAVGIMQQVAHPENLALRGLELVQAT